MSSLFLSFFQLPSDLVKHGREVERLARRPEILRRRSQTHSVEHERRDVSVVEDIEDDRRAVLVEGQDNIADLELAARLFLKASRAKSVIERREVEAFARRFRDDSLSKTDITVGRDS